MSRSVVVVGGGAIGLCAAYFAVRQGHRVTVLERGGPDHDSCSLGNAGMVVPSHFVPLAAPGMVELGLRMLFNPEGPFAIRPRSNLDLLRWCWLFYRSANRNHVARSSPLLRDLNLASRRCFEELASLPGAEFGLQKRGLLMLCKTAAALQEEAHLAEMAHALNMPADVLSPEELARLEPALRLDVAGGIYFPQDCHLDPGRFISWLTGLLQAEGVDFRWGAAVTGWRTGPGAVEAVITTDGEYRAEEFVLAAGSWSGALAKSLGLRLPLQAGKGYSITVPSPRQLPRICAILSEARVAVTPMSSSLRFAGTLEIGGLDSRVNERRVEGIRKSVPRYFPAFSAGDLRGTPVWSGLRPCSPDGLPYLGRSRRYNNLVIAAGHAMMGLSLAPITGKLTAEILTTGAPSIDLALLQPDRFET